MYIKQFDQPVSISHLICVKSRQYSLCACVFCECVTSNEYQSHTIFGYKNREPQSVCAQTRDGEEVRVWKESWKKNSFVEHMEYFRLMEKL